MPAVRLRREDGAAGMRAFPPEGPIAMPSRILICSRRDDQHARIVAAALRKIGAYVALWDMQDYPARQHISVDIAATGARMAVQGMEPDFAQRCDAIWLRRIAWDGHACREAGQPLDLAGLHAAMFMDHILELVPDRARWVNAFDRAIRAESKANQLVAAAAVGFHVPETLVSNDPRAIRGFARSLGAPVVAKPLRAEWVQGHDGSMRSLRAELFDETRIRDDRVLAAGPYVFQRRLDAAFEVRVTVIGHHIFAARIDTQGDDDVVDMHDRTLTFRAFALPAPITQLCVDLGTRLGLAHYCIDLLASDAGTFHFLEVNQAGQFLWLEQLMPEHRCLAAFCALLLGTSALPDVTLASTLASLPCSNRHEPN